MIEGAIIGLRRQRGDEAFGQPREILRAIKRSLAVRIRMRLIEVIDHDQIEIGARRHFPAAEFAERKPRRLLTADTAMRFGKQLFDADDAARG